MATPALLEDLEVDDGEDVVTADIPVTDPTTLPEDLGDAAPAGEEHPLAEAVEPLGGVGNAAGPAPQGLSIKERIRARDLTVEAAALALRNGASIDYTMGVKRWDPIKRNRKAFRGEFGNFEDCSSFATWCLWNGLDHFGVGDVVNGQQFQAGYTGTMTSHGQRVSQSEALRGDLCFYADSHRRISHVAIYIGGGMVISHGSEPGPNKLRMNYRPIVQIRRYIRA
ncbi:MAG: NlpC/P60 family [Solirubrobacteraceae bacterium]|nr:NlpC/P60 family [Solirubrobacteraceae bacterium]